MDGLGRDNLISRLGALAPALSTPNQTTCGKFCP